MLQQLFLIYNNRVSVNFIQRFVRISFFDFNRDLFIKLKQNYYERFTNKN